MNHFIRIPKTASRAIKDTGLFECTRHLTTKRLSQLYSDTWKTDFKFCVVRNPYDRIVSSYFQGYDFYINNIYPNCLEFQMFPDFDSFVTSQENPILSLNPVSFLRPQRKKQS
jgi:hypothetical protein